MGLLWNCSQDELKQRRGYKANALFIMFGFTDITGRHRIQREVEDKIYLLLLLLLLLIDVRSTDLVILHFLSTFLQLTTYFLGRLTFVGASVTLSVKNYAHRRLTNLLYLYSISPFSQGVLVFPY